PICYLQPYTCSWESMTLQFKLLRVLSIRAITDLLPSDLEMTLPIRGIFPRVEATHSQIFSGKTMLTEVEEIRNRFGYCKPHLAYRVGLLVRACHVPGGLTMVTSSPRTEAREWFWPIL